MVYFNNVESLELHYENFSYSAEELGNLTVFSWEAKQIQRT